MLCIGYLSSAARPFEPPELSKLAEVSRKNNWAHGVTGMICYHDGNFLQFLEGGEIAVEKTFEIIRRDQRHLGILELFHAPIQKRLFLDWTMNFARSDQRSAEQQVACQNPRAVQSRHIDGIKHRRLVDTFIDVFRMSAR